MGSMPRRLGEDMMLDRPEANGREGMRIAVLDDELDQQALISAALTEAGHECHCFDRSADLQPGLRAKEFDLLVLDWDLPNLDIGALLRLVRESFGTSVPVILLTHRCDEADLVEALGAGADGFISKPLRVAELQARAEALMRRARFSVGGDQPQDYGRYRFLPAARQLLMDGQPVELKNREYELALLLFQNLGRLLSRDYLRATIWGSAREDGSRSLDTHISRVRSKLALRPEHGFMLTATYGMGYRLESVDPSEMPPSSLRAFG